MADLTRKTAQLITEFRCGATPMAGIYYENVDSMTIGVHGTPSGYSQNISGVGITLPAGTYYLSIKSTNPNSVFYSQLRSADGLTRYVSSPNSFTLSEETTVYPRVAYDSTSTTYVDERLNIMLNAGSQPLPYEPYGWVHSLRKLTTATEAVENPLYSDGTAITAYTIKGNTVQSGTPSPSNPVMPNGVGERTENLFDDTKTINIPDVGDRYGFIAPSGTYSIYNDTDNNVYYGTNDWTGRQKACDPHSTATVNLNTGTGKVGGFFMPLNSASQGGCTIVEGSTPPDHYIPYGYKIPISTLQTVNNYLGSIQSTRQIYKWVLTGQEAWGKQTSSYGYRFYSAMSGHMPSSAAEPLSYCSHVPLGNTYNDAGCYAITATQINISVDSSMQSETEFTAYLAQQYANGTPVTVWYVLQTATTGIVNEPLMKIGTYADTLSNATAIPTTDGANTISVDTTVQPSEFTATWTGWHDAYVKEKSENLIPTSVSSYEQGSISSTDGTDTDSATRIRTIDYYPIDGDTNYYISVDNTSYCYLNLLFYDTNKEFVGQYYTIDGNINGATSLLININSSIVSNVKYFRATFRKADNTNIAPQDIVSIKPMINIGSTALTYAPYWE